MQSTLRPTRLTSPPAPLSAVRQSPSVRASHATCCQGPGIFGAWRERIVTAWPAAARCRASDVARKPLPPAMTMEPDGDGALTSHQARKVVALMNVQPQLAGGD